MKILLEFNQLKGLIEQSFTYKPENILNPQNKLKSNYVKSDEANPNIKPTKKQFAQEILNQGIKFPDVAFAISMLESGNLGSVIYNQNNNAFGMKRARIRPTTAKSEKLGHAVYESWIDSIKDYKLWEENIIRKKNIKTKDEYINILQKIYCPTDICGSDKYSSKIKSMIGAFNRAINAPN